MAERGLLVAIGASVAVHGLALGFGSGLQTPPMQPPRLLEARLVKETLPEEKPATRRIEPPPPAPRPAPREPAHQPKPPTRPDATPVPQQQRLVSAARSDHPAPAIATAAAPAPAVAASQPAAAPGPLAAAAGPATPAPVSYSPPSVGARYLDNPKPGYPMIARRRGLEGTVRLEVRVSAEGIPVAVKLRESGGHDSLDEAATTAVWHWKFMPARRGGEAVEGTVVVPIRFRLGADDAG